MAAQRVHVAFPQVREIGQVPGEVAIQRRVADRGLRLVGVAGEQPPKAAARAARIRADRSLAWTFSSTNPLNCQSAFQPAAQAPSSRRSSCRTVSFTLSSIGTSAYRAPMFFASPAPARASSAT